MSGRDGEMLAVLIAATARPASPAHRAAMRSASDAAVADWPALLRLVERHRVAPLVFERVADGSLAVPADVAQRLRAAAVRDRTAALRLTALLVRLTRTLADAGVRALSLKGPTLALIAYGDVARRHVRDIDLLIDPADLDTAARALAAAGCPLAVPRDGASDLVPRWWARVMKDAEFVDRESGALVELHWRLSNNPHLMPAARLERRTVAIGGAGIETFAPDDLLLYLAVHGAKHFWFRLKWLADVWALTAGMDADRLTGFHDRARAAGLEVPAAAMLLLLQRTYGLPLPTALAARLARSRTTRGIVRWSIRQIESPDDLDATGQRATLMRAFYLILLRRDRRYRADEIGRYAIDLTAFQRRGGTGRALALSVVGRPIFWLMRRLRRAR